MFKVPVSLSYLENGRFKAQLSVLLKLGFLCLWSLKLSSSLNLSIMSQTLTDFPAQVILAVLSLLLVALVILLLFSYFSFSCLPWPLYKELCGNGGSASFYPVPTIGFNMILDIY